MGRADNVMEVSPSGVSSGVLVGHERPDPYVIQWDDWEERGNCFGTSAPDVFVPSTTPRRGGPPPTQCITCPVKAQCLAKGKRIGAEGWWGGVYLRPKKFRRVMTELDEQRALVLWKERKIDRAIGEELGLSQSTIFDWRVSIGLESVTAASRPADELFQSRLDSGLSLAQVADALGCHKSTVRRWIERTNYKRPAKEAS